MSHPTHARDARLPATDRLWAAGLRARHGDLISRYVHRRTLCPQQAASIVEEVFDSAAAQRASMPAQPLPWLIAAARRGCVSALGVGAHRQQPELPAVPPALPPRRSTGPVHLRSRRIA